MSTLDRSLRRMTEGGSGFRRGTAALNPRSAECVALGILPPFCAPIGMGGERKRRGPSGRGDLQDDRCFGILELLGAGGTPAAPTHIWRMLGIQVGLRQMCQKPPLIPPFLRQKWGESRSGEILHPQRVQDDDMIEIGVCFGGFCPRTRALHSEAHAVRHYGV